MSDLFIYNIYFSAPFAAPLTLPLGLAAPLSPPATRQTPRIRNRGNSSR
jgi:hypothetical protein